MSQLEMFVEGPKIGNVTLKVKRAFEVRSDRLNVLSSGGGTQSNAMIVLAYLGYLPKPDIILMVNTEREVSEVFEYQQKYMAPLCEEMGVEYLIPKKSDWTDFDITSPNDNECVLPPFFTELNGRDKDNRCGKQPGFCSDKWKTAVLKKVLNNRFGEKYLTLKGVDSWMGMTIDERRRVKYPAGKWQRRYPLFESGLTRNDCIKIVEEFGLPTPPRSACWMCPNRSQKEWAYMKNNNPEDFQKAVNFEKDLQKDFPWLWLHKDGIPIHLVDFKEDEQVDMSQTCDSGLCFV